MDSRYFLAFIQLFLVVAAIPGGDNGGKGPSGNPMSKKGVCEMMLAQGFHMEIPYLDSNVTTMEDIFTSEQIGWMKALHPTLQTRPTPLIRKEIRQFTDDELQEFHRVMWTMKNTEVANGMGEYEMFIYIHNSDISPGSTRAGPGQLGWHREYVTQFEEIVHRHAPTLALPYWDFSLETSIPTQRDSVVWSDQIFGECIADEDSDPYGKVLSGPFANWTIPDYCDTEYLTRVCGEKNTYIGFTDTEIELILNYTSFSDMYNDAGDCFTADHDQMHGFIWGTTNGEAIKCVVADPASWTFHPWIDYLWQEFRVNSQTTDLETDYPGDDEVVNDYHKASYPMAPFTMFNSDGLSTDYDYWYLYQKRVTDCDTDSDCGRTEFLYCGESRCKSRIKTNGACKLRDTDICMESDICAEEVTENEEDEDAQDHEEEKTDKKENKEDKAEEAEDDKATEDNNKDINDEVDRDARETPGSEDASEFGPSEESEEARLPLPLSTDSGYTCQTKTADNEAANSLQMIPNFGGLSSSSSSNLVMFGKLPFMSNQDDTNTDDDNANDEETEN